VPSVIVAPLELLGFLQGTPVWTLAERGYSRKEKGPLARQPLLSGQGCSVLLKSGA
jgi:hypothetical protein